MKVLIVEDNKAIRDLTEKTVKRAGYDVQAAPDGAQGLKLFKEFKPEVVLSDINMPVMNGLELLEKIRIFDSNTLFIVVSTLDSPEYILQALRLKANDYIVKPFAAKEMLAMLEKYSGILASRTKNREVLGLIDNMVLKMRVGNRLDLVGKIVDRLMIETEQVISQADRFGVHLGLVEMIVNAIEHGNLEITYDEKSQAMEGSHRQWDDLVNNRCMASEYADRLINLDFSMTKDRCEWLITDQGPGFDWKKIPDASDPENLTASHGRGILLTTMQFDEVTYIGKGNQVRLVKNLS